jgi:hypothetical protein
MTLTGFDISNVNGSGIINRALGGDFVICKATEGKSFVDPLYQSFMAKIRAAGKLTGSYHFAHWYNSPTQEAAFYGAHNDRRDGELEILDWEMYGNPVCPPGTHGPWVAEFLAARPRCGIYLNADMANHIIASADAAQLRLIRSRVLWKATYGVSAPGNSFGFDKGVSLWQWRDSTGIDEDIAYLTPQQWRDYANGSATPPPPPKDPDMAFTDAQAAQLQRIDDTLSVVNRVLLTGEKFDNDAAKAYAQNPYPFLQALSGKVDTLAAQVSAATPRLTADDIKALVREVIAGQVNVTATLAVDPAAPSAPQA